MDTKSEVCVVLVNVCQVISSVQVSVMPSWHPLPEVIHLDRPLEHEHWGGLREATFGRPDKGVGSDLGMSVMLVMSLYAGRIRKVSIAVR